MKGQSHKTPLPPPLLASQVEHSNTSETLKQRKLEDAKKRRRKNQAASPLLIAGIISGLLLLFILFSAVGIVVLAKTTNVLPTQIQDTVLGVISTIGASPNIQDGEEIGEL